MDKDEILRTVQVDPKKIVCKTCVYRNLGHKHPHFTKGHCGVYRDGVASKPNSILFEGGSCKYYKRDRGVKK